MPGEGGENACCYECGALLIERDGFAVRLNRIRHGSCLDCGAHTCCRQFILCIRNKTLWF